LGTTLISVTDATTIRNGMKAALQVGFINIHIKGDIKILIQAVKIHIQVSREVQDLIEYI